MRPGRDCRRACCWLTLPGRKETFGDKLPGDSRGAERHYRTLSVEQIKAFPLPPLADDALLLLWRVSSMAEEAYAVCRAWGFVPKAEIVWVKLTRPLDVVRVPPADLIQWPPPLWFGMGRVTRAAHETCLVAKRGRFAPDDRAVRSVFFAQAQKGKHSAKPPEFYEIAERLCSSGPRCELFARTPRAGWTQYGDQLPGRPAAPGAP